MRASKLILAFGAALSAAPVLAQPEPPASASAGDPVAGTAAFVMQCAACHSGTIGPPLTGVFGRRIAGVEGYARYSDALKAKGDQTWTEANLDAFLRDPPQFAPGTRMMMGATDDKARVDIIAYLKSQAAAPAQ